LTWNWVLRRTIYLFGKNEEEIWSLGRSKEEVGKEL
jgi:hypothetical protein